MSAYLINGLSGTGKSTIARELARKGYLAVDTDEEIGYYGNLVSKERVIFPGDRVTDEWYQENGFLWNPQQLEDLINNAGKNPIFFCGGAVNQADFYSKFSKMFLLYIDAETLKKRVTDRGAEPNTNNPAFIRKMLGYVAGAKTFAEENGMIIIDTSTSTVNESVNKILSHVDDNL